MKFYGIRHKQTKKALGLSIKSNSEDEEYCNEYTCFLCDLYSSCPPYLNKIKKTVEDVLNEDVTWYNSSLEKPAWGYGFKNADYEVFEVDIDISL